MNEIMIHTAQMEATMTVGRQPTTSSLIMAFDGMLSSCSWKIRCFVGRSMGLAGCRIVCRRQDHESKWGLAFPSLLGADESMPTRHHTRPACPACCSSTAHYYLKFSRIRLLQRIFGTRWPLRIRHEWKSPFYSPIIVRLVSQRHGIFVWGAYVH